MLLCWSRRSRLWDNFWRASSSFRRARSPVPFRSNRPWRSSGIRLAKLIDILRLDCIVHENDCAIFPFRPPCSALVAGAASRAVRLAPFLGRTRAGATDPLPSWNDGATKSSILDFVTRVTTQGGPDFVPPDQRIATFDNDGTLWVEHPMYAQLAFALDRVKAMAPAHPEWKPSSLSRRCWTAI